MISFIFGILIGLMIGKYLDMAAKYGWFWFLNERKGRDVV